MRHVTPEGDYAFIDTFNLSPNSSSIPVGLERLAPELVFAMERNCRGVLLAAETGFRDVRAIVHSGTKTIMMANARVRLIGQGSRNCIACIENVLAEVL